MFQGFNESTIMYYKAIHKQNSKKVHQDNRQLYLEGVRLPLDELYFDLYNYFNGIDKDLLSDRRRCISSAYNDTRFCRETPIKEYFYIRFKLNKTNKKNALGFFFDASLDGYKYGLNTYNSDALGMYKIREYMLDNKYYAQRVIQDFNEACLLELQGEKYKKAYYPKEDVILQEWLDRKRISCTHEENLSPIFYEREILNHFFRHLTV